MLRKLGTWNNKSKAQNTIFTGQMAPSQCRIMSNPSMQTLISVCHFVYNSSQSVTGTVRSPNYPGLYPRKLECRYTFYGRKDELVTINFDYFSIEGIRLLVLMLSVMGDVSIYERDISIIVLQKITQVWLKQVELLIRVNLSIKPSEQNTWSWYRGSDQTNDRTRLCAT